MPWLLTRNEIGHKQLQARQKRPVRMSEFKF